MIQRSPRVIPHASLREPGDFFLEAPSAVLVVPEHVVRGATRRQQDHAIRTGRTVRDRGPLRPVFPLARRAPGPRLRHRPGPLADQHELLHVAAHEPRERREVLALVAAAGDQHDRRLEALQRDLERAGVRRLGVVHEPHAADLAGALQPVLEPRVRRQDRRSTGAGGSMGITVASAARAFARLCGPGRRTSPRASAVRVPRAARAPARPRRGTRRRPPPARPRTPSARRPARPATAGSSALRTA